MNKKIVSFTKAKKILKELKIQGKKIVFTNGCFDLIHAGHVKYLNKAKKFGDILVIGLNSDLSIKKIKTENRPIISQNNRALLLSAFEFVDYIIIFNEETPIDLLKSLKPDVHIKGGDYKAINLPEYKIVKKYGGKIKILPFIKGCSSTSIINKILGKSEKVDL